MLMVYFGHIYMYIYVEVSGCNVKCADLQRDLRAVFKLRIMSISISPTFNAKNKVLQNYKPPFYRKKRIESLICIGYSDLQLNFL